MPRDLEVAAGPLHHQERVLHRHVGPDDRVNGAQQSRRAHCCSGPFGVAVRIPDDLLMVRTRHDLTVIWVWPDRDVVTFAWPARRAMTSGRACCLAQAGCAVHTCSTVSRQASHCLLNSPHKFGRRHLCPQIPQPPPHPGVPHPPQPPRRHAAHRVCPGPVHQPHPGPTGQPAAQRTPGRRTSPTNSAAFPVRW